MKKIDPKELQGNFIKKIGEQWMLITAGDEKSLNTMTASWGGIGWLWNRSVVYIFIRPERFTHQFVDKHSRFSLTFFDEKYRKTLAMLGEKSGIDCDKVAESGLAVQFTPEGTPYFKEAELVVECRKLYSVEIQDGEFVEKSICDKWYNNEGVHTMYIAEIENCFYLKDNL